MPLDLPDDATLAAYAAEMPREARPAPTGEDSGRLARWLALIGGNVFDAATTQVALGRPGTEEANPLFRGVVRHPAALYGTKIGTGIALSLILDALAKDHPKWANGLAGGAAGLYTGVGVNNLRQGTR